MDYVVLIGHRYYVADDQEAIETATDALIYPSSDMAESDAQHIRDTWNLTDEERATVRVAAFGNPTVVDRLEAFRKELDAGMSEDAAKLWVNEILGLARQVLVPA